MSVEDRTEIVLLYCQHAARDGADVTGACAAAEGLTVRPALMPCTSKVQAAHILRLLEGGADGVQIVACPAKGCRFLVGSLRAERRVEYVRRLLEEIQVGAARVGLCRAARLSADELVEHARTRAAAVADLGPIPTVAGDDR